MSTETQFTKHSGYALIRTNRENYEYNPVYFSNSNTVSRQFVQDQRAELGWKKLEIQEVRMDPETCRTRRMKTPLAIWENPKFKN